MVPVKILMGVWCLSAVGLACSEAEDPDSGTPRDAAVDGGVADGGLLDSGPPDASDSGVGPGDTGVGDGAYLAVPGQRCDQRTRVALLEISGSGNFPPNFALTWDDRPAPWLTSPESSDSSCFFHRYPVSPNCTCSPSQVCDANDQCVDPPQPVPGLSVTIRGSATETFTGDGSLYGSLMANDPSYSLEVKGAGLTVTLGASSLPPELNNLEDSLIGTLEAPDGLHISWDSVAGSSRLYTSVPINHHVGTPTFTECDVPASSGQLHIDGAMLRPLAVITGLEFQGVQHVNFAAAELPGGCFEIRFTRVYPPSL